MPKLTVKKIESLIKRKEFGRHPDGNQLYLNIRDRESWGENQPEPLREIPPMQIVLTGVAPQD